ncbi:MAG: DUF4347 domain-containing protein, partial [Nostocaceae cyanobacterium]|nr:DUF4347 domain-containing protein [Nostocaceae cyanobacterium]
MINSQHTHINHKTLKINSDSATSVVKKQSGIGKNIIFIDSTVNDYQSLIKGANPSAQIVILLPTQDGIAQITTTLQKYPQIEAVHIVSHGSPGCLNLGNTKLSLNSLEKYKSQLQIWSKRISSSSLLLYGCNVAAGDAGEEFIQKLQQLTKANIAASAKPTGSKTLGGDWNLEVTTNDVTPSIAFSAAVTENYQFVLAEPKSDDFNTTSLNSQWNFINPLGDSSYQLTGGGTSDAYLEITVPGGVEHDMWYTDTGAVRVMQAADNSDFGLEAKFASQPTQQYQMQGILVEQDSDDWLRFETYHDGLNFYVFAAATTNGFSEQKLKTAVPLGSASHLRLNRTGDSWTFLYS